MTRVQKKKNSACLGVVGTSGSLTRTNLCRVSSTGYLQSKPLNTHRQFVRRQLPRVVCPPLYIPSFLSFFPIFFFFCIFPLYFLLKHYMIKIRQSLNTRVTICLNGLSRWHDWPPDWILSTLCTGMNSKPLNTIGDESKEVAPPLGDHAEQWDVASSRWHTGSVGWLAGCPIETAVHTRTLVGLVDFGDSLWRSQSYRKFCFVYHWQDGWCRLSSPAPRQEHSM